MSFEEKDYPGLYNSADQFSIDAQKTYTQLFKLELILLIVGAVVGSFSIDDTRNGPYLAMIAAVVFIFGLALSFYLNFSKFEDKWYIGRAIAESIKSITWRYMVCGEPYNKKIHQQEVDKNFRTTLREILLENREFISGVIHEDNFSPISEAMRKIRQLNFSERLSFYVDNRIREQKTWYLNKAEANRGKRKLFFGISTSLYASAIVYHLVLIANNELFNGAPIIATAVGCILSWTKMKQYQELSQSYMVTAHEISLIEDESREVSSEERLSIFIGDSEAAFSREHTLWLARRDIN